MDLKNFDHHAQIEGTTIFDGAQAMKGYALNKMCYSFNEKASRDAFLADPAKYAPGAARLTIVDAKDYGGKDPELIPVGDVVAAVEAITERKASHPSA